MKRIILFLFISSLFGCNTSNDEHVKSGNEHKSTEEIITHVEKPKTLPRSEFEIAEGGIGIIKLGDSFDSLEFKFKHVDTLTMSSEGYDWSAKRIDLGNGEWILAEGDAGSVVTRMHTNSPKYKTAKGTHVGQLFAEVLKSGEQIGIAIDEGSMSINLIEQGISISVDSISENQFYNSINQELKDIPSTATIDEIGIF